MKDPFKNISKTLNGIERAYLRSISLYSISITLILLALNYIFEKLKGHLPAGGKYFTPALLPLTVTLFLLAFFLFIMTRKIRNLSRGFNEELDFIGLMKNHSSEIIILLDELGRIINHNTALSRALNIDHESLLGKPLREIFFLTEIENDVHYRQLVLDKLKNAFMGIESEIITTVFLKQSRDIHTIHLKLKPILVEDELHRIFVTGRLLHSDYITNKWLAVEKASYILENDISLVHLFSYRLVRNLDGKIPGSQILYLQIALQETIINAIEHGNLEIDYKTKTELKQRGGNYWEFLVKECCGNMVERKIYVEYSLEKEQVRYTITDEGKGFDWKKFMKEDTRQYSHQFLSTYHGVGLQMVRRSFDRILFNEKGNEITLIKYIDGEKD